jgi:hypothetical protein
VAQVEARVEPERHEGGRRVRRALAGHDRHLALAVHAHRVVAGGERIDAVQVVALHPILQFAGCIAGVGADFKHGYHHDFDRNRLGLGGAQGGQGEKGKQNGEESRAHGH